MSTAIQPGAVIDGKYRVVRRIGEGGMGTVYEGENVRIERRVAIKVLHEHVASSPEFAQRFEREARTAARIASPHVCDVLDVGDLSNGEPFIVMEFLEGESLEDRIEKGPMSAHDLAPIAFEILDGLGAMHRAGVIHRDLKPANVYLSRLPGVRARNEVVKILDFGVAKVTPRGDEPAAMTSTGMMMGTPLYMSPEQARGARDVDGRTDIYAASVIFYRALTGAMPHTGLNLHELLFKIVLEDPRPILDLAPDTDPMFAELVTRGLARDPDVRFESARAYQEAIAAWGNAQARTSFTFEVTLPDEPPVLLSTVNPQYNSAAMKAALTPITGPAFRDGRVTPAQARTQPNDAKSPAAVTRASTPMARQNDGTPIVWSDDAPKVAELALQELEKRAVGSSTEILDTKKKRGAGAAGGAARPEAPVTAPVPASAHRASTPARSPTMGRVAIGAGVLIAAVAVGVASYARRAAVPQANATTNSATTSAAAVDVPLPATAAATTSAPMPTEAPPAVAAVATASSASATASGSAAPVHLTVLTGTAPPAPVPTHATPAPTVRVAVNPPPSAKSAAVAPAPPTPTASTRKFRTNLE